MTYTLDIDPVARAQIRELPPAGAVALASALAVLELVPERGEPLNADNRPAHAEPDLAGGQFVGDGPGIGSDRASRSSLVTTRVSPSRHAASACRSPALPVGAGQSVVDVNAVAGTPSLITPSLWHGLVVS